MAKALHHAATFLHGHARQLRQIADGLIQGAPRRSLLGIADKCDALARELDEDDRGVRWSEGGERSLPLKERR